MTGLSAWLESVSGEGWLWFIKRLSGNDTLANDAHQAGPYVPNRYAFRLYPSLWARKAEKNPRVSLAAVIDSDQVEASPQFIYYNDKTRNECRITAWGGSKSPILDPDATGALCVFAFFKDDEESDASGARVWLCANPEEEDIVESRVAPVEPGKPILYDVGGLTPDLFTEEKTEDCWLTPQQIPSGWKLTFPEAQEIVAFAIARLKAATLKAPDERLLDRRECEYAVFRSVEEFFVLPRMKEGFGTVDLFIDFANSVTNRRKSRAGQSLELHAASIFGEEGLGFSRGRKSEGNKRPDFLFPSVDRYHDQHFPSDKLRMLAAKTTCKDRWRQILNEANRIAVKHLLTLQHGISESQFAEMKEEGVILVVPRPLVKKYPKSIRHEIVTLDSFISETKAMCS